MSRAISAVSRELTWQQEQTIKATQVSQLEEELAKAREENAALLARAKELDDVEISRKKAEAKAQQLEERMDEIIAEKVSQKENELNATYDEKMRNYEDK